MRQSPLISIGVPAYNSANTIQETLESLLAQTYGDFELIVSDNASTDLTREITESLARQDSRIRYIRQQENVGANRNYSHLVEMARGEYFKWSSSSDLYAPQFLEKCLKKLEATQGAVLASPRTKLFENSLADAKPYEYDIEIVDPSPYVRLKQLVSTLQLNNAMNGLIRVEALRRTRLIDMYMRADEVMMGHLAMLGKLAMVDDYLYFRRMDKKTSTALQDLESKRRHHYPITNSKILFQTWKRYFGWFRASTHSPLTIADRSRIQAYILKMAYWEKRNFLDDLLTAFQYATTRRVSG